jgi:hypothetical protein
VEPASGAALAAGIAGFASAAGFLDALAALAAFGMLLLEPLVTATPAAEALRAVLPELLFGLATFVVAAALVVTAGMGAAVLRVVPVVFAAAFFAGLFFAVVVTEAFIFPCPHEQPSFVRVRVVCCRHVDLARPPLKPR